MSLTKALLSSIGQKMLLACTGLFMFLLFLLPHMGGNILILFGQDTFNSYAMHLHSLKPVLIMIEVTMTVAILIHMVIALRTVHINYKARGKKRTSSKERTLTARLMPISGLMIFIFIIKHLLDFKLYEKTMVMLDGHLTEDVYTMVLTRFDSLGHTAFYVFFMIAVGLHLNHALQSSVQTLGIYVPRTGSKLKALSTLVAVVVAGTFAILPIVAYLR